MKGEEGSHKSTNKGYEELDDELGSGTSVNE
jgi:hypothetical protein